MKFVGLVVLVAVTSFDSVDTDNSDLIDFNEFEKWHKNKLGITSDEEIKSRFAKYDLSHDKVLDVSEFVPLAYEISRKPVDATEQIFRRMDLNNDRTVDASEIAVARKEYDSGQYFMQANYRIIDSLLAAADVNNDGNLTFEEFSAQLNYTKPKSELTEAEIAQVLTGLDTNRDGFLTIDELERIPSKITELANFQPPPSV
uniref:EF hand n=1 Tax=Angiostrongylus cantonensis TaxID=6313 RepID=A0A158PB85_ANGCA